jgi:hypothetical protein
LFRSQRQNSALTSASRGKACTLCTWWRYSGPSPTVRHTDTGEMPSAAAPQWRPSTALRVVSPLMRAIAPVRPLSIYLRRSTTVSGKQRSTDTNVLVMGTRQFVCSSAYRCQAPSVLSRISASTRCISVSSEHVYAILHSARPRIKLMSTAEHRYGESDLEPMGLKSFTWWGGKFVTECSPYLQRSVIFPLKAAALFESMEGFNVPRSHGHFIQFRPKIQLKICYTLIDTDVNLLYLKDNSSVRKHLTLNVFGPFSFGLGDIIHDLIFLHITETPCIMHKYGTAIYKDVSLSRKIKGFSFCDTYYSNQNLEDRTFAFRRQFYTTPLGMT